MNYNLHQRLLAHVSNPLVYFDLVDKLWHYHSLEARKTRRWLLAVVLLMIYRAIILAMFVTNPHYSKDEHLQVLYFDMVTIEKFNHRFIIVTLMVILQMPFCIFKFYPIQSNHNFKAILSVRKTIEGNQQTIPSLFQINQLWTKVSQLFFHQDLTTLFVKKKIFTNSTFCGRIQQLLFCVGLTSKISFIVLEVYFLRSQIYLYGYLTRNPSIIASPIFPLRILYTEWNIVGTFVCIYFGLKMYTDLCCFIIIFTLVHFHRFKANEYLLRKPCLDKRSFNKFCRTHNRIFQNILQMNRVVGPLLLIFFTFNYPSNAYMMVYLMLDFNRMSTTSILAMSLFLLYQFVIIFGIHLLAITYTTRIHRFTRPLIGVSLTTTRAACVTSVCHKLKMSHYIQYFLTLRKNSYGLTYGVMFGVISFAAFTRVSCSTIIIDFGAQTRRLIWFFVFSTFSFSTHTSSLY